MWDTPMVLGVSRTNLSYLTSINAVVIFAAWRTTRLSPKEIGNLNRGGGNACS